MADLYSAAFVGVRDGTKNPPDRADGRLVGAKASKIVAAKVAGAAIASGDQLFLGTLRAGETLREITINTDTSLGATTVAIGTKASTGKYRTAAVFTTPLDVPTNIGPKASTAGAVAAADEDIWATFAAGGVGGAVNLVFELEIASIK